MLKFIKIIWENQLIILLIIEHFNIIFALQIDT